MPSSHTPDIPSGAREFPVVFLDQGDFEEEWGTPPPADLTDAISDADRAAEFDLFDAKLRATLTFYGWKSSGQSDQDGDFLVFDGWSGMWGHSGGTFTTRIQCPAYVRALLDTIASLPHPRVWGYHTDCSGDDDSSQTVFGKFFVRDGRMYVPVDGNDYAGRYAPWAKAEQQKAEIAAVTGNIHTAAHVGNLRDVKRLVALNPALLNAPRRRTKDTPLHLAVRAGNLKMVQWLLQAGAAPNARRAGEDTPLHEAVCRNGKTSIVQLLLAAGAEVNARDHSGQTPLFSAALIDLTKLAELLLRHGADPNARATDGDTPMHYAAISGSCKVAAMLLEHGADINACDEQGIMPLDRAMKRGHTALVKLLQAHGATMSGKLQH